MNFYFSIEGFYLRFPSTGAASAVARLQKYHGLGASTIEIAGAASARAVLTKSSLDVRGNTGVEGTVTGLDHVDTPVHPQYLRAPPQLRQ